MLSDRPCTGKGTTARLCWATVVKREKIEQKNERQHAASKRNAPGLESLRVVLTGPHLASPGVIAVHSITSKHTEAENYRARTVLPKKARTHNKIRTGTRASVNDAGQAGSCTTRALALLPFMRFGASHKRRAKREKKGQTPKRE